MSDIINALSNASIEMSITNLILLYVGIFIIGLYSLLFIFKLIRNNGILFKDHTLLLIGIMAISWSTIQSIEIEKDKLVVEKVNEKLNQDLGELSNSEIEKVMESGANLAKVSQNPMTQIKVAELYVRLDSLAQAKDVLQRIPDQESNTKMKAELSEAIQTKETLKEYNNNFTSIGVNKKLDGASSSEAIKYINKKETVELASYYLSNGQNTSIRNIIANNKAHWPDSLIGEIELINSKLASNDIKIDSIQSFALSKVRLQNILHKLN